MDHREDHARTTVWVALTLLLLLSTNGTGPANAKEGPAAKRASDLLAEWNAGEALRSRCAETPLAAEMSRCLPGACV